MQKCLKQAKTEGTSNMLEKYAVCNTKFVNDHKTKMNLQVLNKNLLEKKSKVMKRRLTTVIKGWLR